MLIEPHGETEFTSDGVRVISDIRARNNPIEIKGMNCVTNLVLEGGPFMK